MGLSTDEREELERIRRTILYNAGKVRDLGDWKNIRNTAGLILCDIPTGRRKARGLSFGVISALDPNQKKWICASLAWRNTLKPIEKIQKEVLRLPHVIASDITPAIIFLSGFLLQNGPTTRAEFLEQLHSWKEREKKRKLHFRAAREMIKKLPLLVDTKQGYPLIETRDRRGKLAAYILGYPFIVERNTQDNCRYIQTVQESLGLEEFIWPTKGGKKWSGPVNGQDNHVRCATQDVFDRALACVEYHFH